MADETDVNEGLSKSHCYAEGWRPEKALKQMVLDMVDIVFQETSTIEESEMAASTIVEAIHPEIMAKATENDRRHWDGERL